MSNEDFFLTFGSNAASFSARMIRELKPARAEITALQGMLDKLEQDANGPKAPLLNALSKTLGGQGGGQGGGTGAYGLNQIHEAVTDFRKDLGDLARELRTVVQGIKASQGATGRVNRGQAPYWDPGTKGYVKTADVRAGNYPDAFRAGSLPIDPTLMRGIAAQAARGVVVPGGPNSNQPLKISSIDSVKLDQASFDRVIRAIREVRDEVRKIAVTRPAAGPATKSQTTVATTSSTAEASEDVSLEAREAALQRRLSEVRVKADRLAGLMAQAGGAIEGNMEEVVAELTQTENAVKSELAKLERERTGTTRGQQSVARREEAARTRAPDLDEAEYDRRVQMRQRLNLALNEGAFMGSIGTGRGQLKRADLTAMADQLTKMGFATPYTSKTRVQDLGQSVVSGRQAMLAQYGPEIPSELQTGRRIVADRVSDAVRAIIGNANISAAEAAEEMAAREGIRAARLAGYLPKDPTLALPAGADRAIGQSAVTAPRGLVKGGEYDDRIFKYIEGMEMLQGRALGRAANLAMDPNYDPYRVNVSQEITGQGDEAREARQAFRALRRATLELDDLADEFQTAARAIDENEHFIERASNRLERLARGDKLSASDQERTLTDASKIDAARANIARLQGVMASDKFKGLQEVFESSQFQEGHENRQISRASYMRQIDEIARADRETYVADAAGLAQTRTRLATGTKDTYISDLPGVRYDPRKQSFAYKDPAGRDPEIMRELTRFFRATQGGLRREETLAEEAKKSGDYSQLAGQVRSTENAATAYLNRLEKIVGFAPPIEQVIGRPAASASNKAAEDRRRLQYESTLEERDRKLKPQTPEQLLEGARRSLRDATLAESATKKKLTAVETELARVEGAEAAARKKLIAGLDADARAAYDAVQAKHKEATKRLRAADDALKAESSRKHEDAKYGRQRDPATGAFVDPFKRSELGYDIKDAAGTPLGYGRAAATATTEQHLNAIAKAEQDLAQAEADLAAATGTDQTATERLTREKRELTRRLAAQGQSVEAARTRATQYENELRGVSSKVPDVGTQDQRAAAKEASAELRELAETLERATKAQRRLTEIREQLKKPGADTAALRAERDAIKGAEGYLSQNEIKALRKQYHSQLAAGVAAGGAGGGDGGKPPTARAAAGGGDGGDDNILKQILTVLNGIHRTLQTGVRISGTGTRGSTTTAGEGTPRKPSTSSSLYTGQIGSAAASSGNERQLALAAVAQERVAQKLKQAAKEQGVELGETAEMQRLHTAALTADTAWERKNAEEKRKSAALTRTQARQLLDLNNAKKLLDDSSRRELAELRKLAAAGASNEKIVEQQAKAYAALDAAMARQGAGATDRRFYAQQLLSEANVRPDPRGSGAVVQGPRVTRTEVDEIARSARGPLQASMEDVGRQGRDALAHGLFGERGFWGRIMGSTGAFIVRNFAAGFVFGITNALQDVIYQGIITESTWIRVSDALEQTGRSAGSLRSDLQAISADYGVALNDVYMTAAGLAGVFEDVQDIASATRIVAQLQAISMGALTAQESMGVLASITGAYKDELREGEAGLRQVADTLTVVQNVIGANVEVTSEGVGALSGLAQQLKIPFAEMAVYVAQIAKLTNQTGAAAGEQFSRILAAFQSGRGRAALSEALPDSGIEQLLGAGEYGQAIQVLMRQWDSLSDSQQRNLAVAIAGQRQARAFAALMSDTGKTLEATARAHDANGEAQKRADAIAATLNGRLQRLQTNFQNLAQNLMRSGLLNVFGVLLGGVNLLLSGLNKFISAMNDISDNSPFLNILKNWAFGLIGLVAALKLAQIAFTGFRNAYKTAAAGEGIAGAFLGGGRGPDDGRVRLRDSFAAAPAYLTGVSNPDSSRYGTSQRVEDSRAKLANAAANGESRAKVGLLRAEAVAAKAANASARGLGAGLSALATAGLAANLALVGLTVGLTLAYAEFSKRRQYSEDARGIAEQYNPDGSRKTATQLEDEYIGPATDLYEKEFRRRTSVTSMLSSRQGLSAVTSEIPVLGGISNLLGGDIFGFGSDDAGDKWREYYGIANERVASDMAALEAALDESISQVDDGRSALQSRAENKGLFDIGALGAEFGVIVKDRVDPVKVTIGQAEALAGEVNDEITKARGEILNDSSLSDEEKNQALAQLEEIAAEARERATNIMLLARGLQEIDILSSDQIKQLNQIRPVFQAIQGTGIDVNSDIYGDGLQALIEETGISEGSKVGGIMRILGEGNLSRIDAMKQDYKLIKETYKSAEGRYLSAVAGEGGVTYDEDQIEAFKTDMLTSLNELIGETEAMIQALVQSSTQLAEAAAIGGRYGQASNLINEGLAEIAGLRDRGSETDEVRAQRDLLESTQAQKAAEYSAQKKNGRLQMLQAESGSSQRDAALEARITQNAYQALIQERKAMQAVGAQGPPMAAIRAAKIAWINAEMSLTQQAQAANIAAMTAAAASLWNGIAVGQAQEAIALQQYNDAVANAGADSAEALNALAGYTNAQHSTMQTLDAVAQATRDAALASIPQGDAVRVAQVTLSNARAALAAAARYGHNSVEYQSALAQVYSAQQALVQAEADAVLARIGVTIALAEAAGNTVKAAFLQLRQARAALRFAIRRSGGANSAEVANARAEAISAEAALRDAKLQDDLDTIDFNLEMGRITQGAAIAALREILRTRELTKQQRRDLLLQIKGMREEMSEGIWNFGDIDLPKPYLMRRYIEKNRKALQQQYAEGVQGIYDYHDPSAGAGVGQQFGHQQIHNDHRRITIIVKGDGNERLVRRIIREEIGTPGRTRTAQPRRGRM